jgi:protein O-GlcNAc transferase
VAEALWQGGPVVTLKGNRFSSRYGASLVTAAGCPELVAMTDQEYVNLAIELGNARDRLRHYRVHLRHMAVESGLSDPKKFAVRLDAAYESMIAPMQVRKDATLVST